MPATPTLRVTQTSIAPGQHQVQLALDGVGRPQAATARFAFQLTDRDREDLRWYLEDYLEYPIDPAPAIAARVERRMAEVGRELFTAIFDSRDGWSVWGKIHDQLHHSRIEVVSDVEAAAVLPWELLRDPRTDNAVALDAHTFVRAEHETAKHPEIRPLGGGRIRVLLVICRPGGRADVPFRSVASHLVRLSAQARETFQLDVLRPPTFRQLAAVLRAAADRGEPYHVVHFDGHGTWTDVIQTGAGSGGLLSRWRYSLLSPAREGPHGYLLFEDPGTSDNQQLVDGPALGRLLVNTRVPVLVLNACRSAHADFAPAPQTVVAAADAHSRVRAYGSLAQEVVDQGVAGVVAMRYSVYVVTAAQFIADLYAALLQGLPLGTAVSHSRNQLAEQPSREIAFTPRPLQDWVVPVVYEAVPLELFAKPPTDERLVIALDQGQASQERARLGTRLPAGPEMGFFGRDETLLALDRAFDSHRVVLLHAFAGAGKTSTAVEFARWYTHTGGIRGPVLFTSFEYHIPLARVLDQVGAAFEQPLEQAGVHWLALDDAARRQVAVQLLGQVPVLWIWDNVEPVHGFPEGTPSVWTQQEQDELAGFLRALARDTEAKVLLTSRRDERAWLGELPARVGLPSMPMAERVQLARAVASRHGHRLAEVEDWRPLLAYTQGNPLTVTVLVGQALRGNLRTRKQVEGFVTRLRAGEARLEDDQAQGRSRSLAASLGYGFETAFTEVERAQLAVLHLFQGFVDVVTLRHMGEPAVAGNVGVPALARVSEEQLIGLLDRAAKLGLLTQDGGDHSYTVHPALPWYFQALFTTYCGPPGSQTATSARRAYTHAIAELGNYCFNQYEQGRAMFVGLLGAHEANLLHALDLACANDWWESLGTMQGLRALYSHTGRWVDWARLVDQLTPLLVDPATDQPRPGHEDQWVIFNEYRVQLARRARDWPLATRLQHAAVLWNREQAKATLAANPATVDDEQRRLQVRSLGAALHTLAVLLGEQQRPDCIAAFTEALELAQRIGDRQGEAATALNLSIVYLDVPAVRDLDQAERWSQHALDHSDPADDLNRAKITGHLGQVHLERVKEAAAAGQPAPVLAHLNAALDATRQAQQALNRLPADAVDALITVHNQFGIIYQYAGQVDAALGHYREALRYEEAAGNQYRAAMIRHNVAELLAMHGRLDEAQLWAQAALDGFQAVGSGAADDLADAEQLLARIEQARQGGTSNPT